MVTGLFEIAFMDKHISGFFFTHALIAYLRDEGENFSEEWNYQVREQVKQKAAWESVI